MCVNCNGTSHDFTANSLCKQVKFSAFTQEVVRRLLHTNRRLPMVKLLECLENFSQKMANSDHRTVYIRKVLITGIEKYDTKLKKSLLPAGDPAYKPLQLGTHYNLMGRWKKKVSVAQAEPSRGALHGFGFRRRHCRRVWPHTLSRPRSSATEPKRY